MLVEQIKCKRCSLNKPPNKNNRHLCDECVRAENNRISHYRNLNYNWMEVSKEAELELWERQPGETDHEWNVWLHYRDAYPGKKPSYRQVAEEITTSVAAVRKIGNRWSFPTRIQAWAKYIDDLTLKQRQEEVIAMNKRHIDMADAINSKLEAAIMNIDPSTLSPNEIKGLYKTATEIERKARLDQPDMRGSLVDDENPDLKKTDIKTSDISSILGILQQAGVMNAGVRQTVTTEVVTRDDDGNRYET